MPDAYSARLDAAVHLALRGFRGIHRKASEVPYVTHLFAVTALVGEHGGDEDQLIAAMLHDYVEDVDPGAAPMLAATFGPRVADMVLALSDSFELPKPPWRPRKEAYLAKLAGLPADIKLVSAADKLHNCSTIREDVARDGLGTFERFNGRQDGTLWYHRGVVEALGTGWSHRLHARLVAEVDALHALVDDLAGT